MKPAADQGLQVDPAAQQAIQAGSLRSTMGDPRYPALNPLNGAGLEPTFIQRSSYYGDAQITDVVPGFTRLGGIEQRMVEPRGANAAGHPNLGLPMQVADQLAAAPYGLPLGHGEESAFALGTDTGRVGSTGRNVRRKRSS